MTPDITTARRISEALITHQYPHDLFEIRRQVAKDYGTMPDAEELAAQEMDAYCTQAVALAERKLWADTIEKAKAFLDNPLFGDPGTFIKFAHQKSYEWKADEPHGIP